MSVISYSDVTLSNINDGVSLIETIITYAVSSSGTIAPSADLTDENGLVLIDSDGEHLITDFTWSDTIPECPDGWYLWARTVFVYSDGSRVCVYSVSRQGVNGQAGEKGDNGVSVSVIYIYQRTTSIPAVPTHEITYSFSDGEITGDIGNWSQTIPSGVNDLWVTFATASSNTGYDTISPAEWGTPVKFVQNGLGVSSTTIDYGVSSSGSAQPTNWSPSLPTPTKGQWLWIRTVFTYTDGSTVTSFSKSYVGTNGYVHVAWANSADGSVDFSTTDSEGKLYIGVCTNETQAAPTVYSDYSWSLIRGEDGYNKATINLYQRSDTAPAKPTQTTSYTFSTGILSPVPTNWSTNIPPTNGRPCYMIAVSAVSQEDIYMIQNNYWTDPVKLVEDGYNQAMINLYKRSETAPSAPTSACTYTFATGDLSPIPTGWSTEIPAANGTPCYVTTAYAISLGATYEFGSTSWSEPVKFAADGYSQANVQLYKRASTTPSKPGVTTTYTFSTGALSPIPTGWSLNVPETNSNREPCYITTVKFAIQGDIHTISPNDWSVPVKFVVDGVDGQDGATVNKITQQYAISTSETQLPVSPTWVNDLPEIDSTANPRQWIWSRWKIETDDGNITYTDAVCSVGMSGVSFKADSSSKSIVSKIWETDITTKINEYDQDVVTDISDRVTSVEQTRDSWSTKVAKIDTIEGTVSNHTTQITATSNKIALMATFNNAGTEFSLTEDMIEAITDQFIIKDSSGSSTVISGGKIAANSITLGEVASDISGLGATATNYIKIDGSNGIRVQDSADNTDYIRISSSAIDVVRNSVSKVYIEDGAVRVGTLGTPSSKKRNIYITDSSIQFRNYTDVLAKWDATDGIILYQGNGNAAVSIGTSSASFTGTVHASAGEFTGEVTATSGTIGGCSITNGVLQVGNANIENISAGKITSGTMSANRISGGSIDATDVTITNLNASNITSGTLSASRIDTSSITLSEIKYNSNNRATVSSSGLDIYQDGSKIASFGSTISMGKTNSTSVDIASNGEVQFKWSGSKYGSILPYVGFDAGGLLIEGSSSKLELDVHRAKLRNDFSSSAYTEVVCGNESYSATENYIRIYNYISSSNYQKIVLDKNGIDIECSALSVNGTSWTRTTSVTSGSSSLVTSGGVYTYVNNPTVTDLSSYVTSTGNISGTWAVKDFYKIGGLYVLNFWVNSITGSYTGGDVYALQINSSYKPTKARTTGGFSKTAIRDSSATWAYGSAHYVCVSNTSSGVTYLVISSGLLNHCGGIWGQLVWY